VTIPDSVVEIGYSAFDICYDLTTVYYQGSYNFSDVYPFYNNVKKVCVPPDYKYDEFGNKPVSTNDDCKDFQDLFNHCYKGAFIDGGLVQQVRKNATMFEGRTDGCVECHCYNDTGPVSWSLCNSTDKVNKVCVDGFCNESRIYEENTWIVEIKVDDDVKPEELDTAEMSSNITSLTGLSEDEFTIGFEIDGNGHVVRIILYVKDEKNANMIADAVDDIKKGEGCTYGIFCRTTGVRVTDGEFLMSNSPRVMISLGVASIMIIVMMLF